MAESLQPTAARVLLDATRGSVFGYMVYIVPSTVMRLRKPTRPVLRSALAVAVLAGSYKILREAAEELEEDSWIRRRASSLCGAAATGLGVLVDPSWASSLFSTWYFLKGLRMSGLLPNLKYGPLLTAMVATGVVCPAAYCNPVEHHPSYWAFLKRWVTAAGVTTDQWRFPPPGEGKTLSDGCHPGQSILSFVFGTVVPANFVNSLKIYIPLYALQGLRNYQRFEAVSWSKNMLRSTVFLTTYISSLWLGLLTQSKMLGGAIPRPAQYTWTWVTALALLIERKSRRVELASYISAHAINSVYRHFMLRGFYKPRTWFGAMLLMISSYWVFGDVGNGKPGVVSKWIFGEVDRTMKQQQQPGVKD